MTDLKTAATTPEAPVGPTPKVAVPDIAVAMPAADPVTQPAKVAPEATPAKQS